MATSIESLRLGRKSHSGANPETIATPTIPDPRSKMTLDELASVQSLAASHLTFSLTLACPLKCSHCIVNAGPHRQDTTMPLAVAEAYAAQMSELSRYGITTISFTGGEPLLARKQLKAISDAAAQAGLVCGVVTAAHWATSEEAAANLINSLPGIGVWDISLDTYHEDFVKRENVKLAYETAKKLGRLASVRYSYHDPPTPEDYEVLAFIEAFTTPKDLCGQKIRKVGRGGELSLPASQKYHPWTKPCVTQGLVVRYDGSLAPCCVNMVEERQHPFQFGDARHQPLAAVHAAYLSHPLLQLVRVIGFAELMRWLEEAELLDSLPEPWPDDVCDLCPQLFTHPRLGPYLAARAATPENRLRTAILTSKLLGEHRMLQTVVGELENDGGPAIEGFALARNLAHEVAARLPPLPAAAPARSLPVLP